MSTIYATVTVPAGHTYKLAAKRFDDMVSIWQVGGAILGDWKLERFEGSVLNAKTLKGLFENP